MIRLWVDGACLKNPGGAGGWAFLVEDKGSGRVLYSESGGEAETTNNRMELTAVLEALRWAAHRDEPIEVWSDSRYVVSGCTSWIAGWKALGWERTGRKGKRTPVKNVELWQAIDALLTDPTRDAPRFVWVKGHNGTALNERADQLACEAAEVFAS